MSASIKYTSDQMEKLSKLMVIDRVNGMPVFADDGESVCFCPYTGAKVIFIGSGLKQRTEDLTRKLINGDWLEEFSKMPDSLL